MSRPKRVELYDHDDDLCARACGRGCSRNTHAQGFADGQRFRDAEVADLRKRIRLARKAASLIGWKVGAQDQVDRLLDLRRPTSHKPRGKRT